MKNKYFWIFLICLFGFAVAAIADESKSEETIGGDIFGKGGGIFTPLWRLGEYIQIISLTLKKTREMILFG